MSFFKNKTVVVPFDFSDSANTALDTTLAMVDESTRLHVIHVVEPTPTIISLDPAMPIPPANDTDRHHRAKEELDRIFSEGKYSRFNVDCEIGDPGTEIVNFANSVRAGMIVMSSHGRTGLARLLLGSVAEKVVRSARCPVLILRGESQI